jgi:hypothetical protein
MKYKTSPPAPINNKVFVPIPVLGVCC